MSKPPEGHITGWGVPSGGVEGAIVSAVFYSAAIGAALRQAQHFHVVVHCIQHGSTTDLFLSLARKSRTKRYFADMVVTYINSSNKGNRLPLLHRVSVKQLQES